MSILVDDKPIEIRLKYADRAYAGGAVGVITFTGQEEEDKWIDKENEKRNKKAMELKALNKDVPPELEADAKSEVKEVVTFWKRMDWGTQTLIINDSQKSVEFGESSTDWTKYRLSQMKNLMVGWDLKTSKGEAIPITEKILKRLDFNIAIALISKYEETIAPDSEELENLE